MSFALFLQMFKRGTNQSKEKNWNNLLNLPLVYGWFTSASNLMNTSLAKWLMGENLFSSHSWVEAVWGSAVNKDGVPVKRPSFWNDNVACR